MQFPIRIFLKATVPLAFFFLLACATTQQMQEKDEGRVVDLGNYTVAIPPGKGWQVNVKWEKGASVEFISNDKEISIGVIQYVFSKGDPLISEEKLINNLRNGFENIVRKKGDLKYLDKDIIMVEGKNLYRMRYKVIGGGGLLYKPVGDEGQFFIYFQPEVAATHNVYIFYISKVYLRGPISGDLGRGLREKEVNLIYHVINSLQFK